MRDPLKDAYDRGFQNGVNLSRSEIAMRLEEDPRNRIVQELKEAIEELPNLHPEGTVAHHVDMLHRDRLRVIVEQAK